MVKAPTRGQMAVSMKAPSAQQKVAPEPQKMPEGLPVFVFLGEVPPLPTPNASKNPSGASLFSSLH